MLEDPHTPGHLIAGTPGGVWSSRDRGLTWQHAEAGLGNMGVLALAAAKPSEALFAGGTNGTIYARQPGFGAAWRRISPTLTANPIFSLAVSPADGQTLLAGTVGALYRGVRTGDAWRWRRVATTGDSSVTAINWAPWVRGQIFASVFGATPPVLRSDNDGQNWQADDRGLPPSLPTEALLPLPGATPRLLLSTMGGGVWQRMPGDAWQDISAGLPEHHAMPMIAAHDTGGVAYAGTMGKGVYRWQAGNPWQQLGHDLTGGRYIVLSLALTGNPHPILVAGTGIGVFRYTGAP